MDTTCDVVVIEIASDHFYSTVAHHHGEHTTLYKIIKNVCTKPQREYINNIVFLTHHTGAHKECNRDERGNKKMKLKSLVVLFVEVWED